MNGLLVVCRVMKTKVSRQLMQDSTHFIEPIVQLDRISKKKRDLMKHQTCESSALSAQHMTWEECQYVECLAYCVEEMLTAGPGEILAVMVQERNSSHTRAE